MEEIRKLKNNHHRELKERKKEMRGKNGKKVRKREREEERKREKEKERERVRVEIKNANIKYRIKSNISMI